MMGHTLVHATQDTLEMELTAQTLTNATVILVVKLPIVQIPKVPTIVEAAKQATLEMEQYVLVSL